MREQSVKHEDSPHDEPPIMVTISVPVWSGISLTDLGVFFTGITKALLKGDSGFTGGIDAGDHIGTMVARPTGEGLPMLIDARYLEDKDRDELWSLIEMFREETGRG